MMDRVRLAAQKVWASFRWAAGKVTAFIIRYPVAIIVTTVTLVTVFVLAFSNKTIQIGGLFGKLWGKKKPEKNQKNEVTSGRVDESGKQIQPGQSDDGGWVQATVTTDIEDPGIFDDPDVVTIIHPGNGEFEVPLPTGVKNADVKEVVEIHPDAHEVRRNDKGTDAKEVLSILKEKR